MNDFEQELRAALCRRDPPPGFSARVMARVPRQSVYPRWLAIAAMLLILLGGVAGWQIRQRQQQLAAERAKAELIYALEVTANGLQTARAMLLRQAGGKKL